MNKKELIKAAAQAADIPESVTAKALNGILEAIGNALETGDSVALTGFGTFSVRERAAREGHNPQTNQPITIAASKAPAFKAGRTLKDRVNK